eukprot:gnl/MRDRNA2_/MRDRNA2_176189_c0_seq1.p1 gnl/MRDRNA2_/MRDRNA2_176189_c0~~gnl/MRDRNA2_/MRDRNA2_176189_c0_seq1.p1  ORF type:complete len:233 (+),score=29.77 gnl/MRDRNA2_/MRDRNA2_176189_c0_seq1:78-701(+)
MAGKCAWLVSAMIAMMASASYDSSEDDYWKLSTCRNQVQRGKDERVELTLEASAGNRHTDANGFCEFGHTGVDGHCMAPPCLSPDVEKWYDRPLCTTFYECKCLSPDEAAQMHEAQKNTTMTTLGIIGGLLMVFAIGVCVSSRKSTSDETAKAGKYVAGFMFFASIGCIGGIIYIASQGGVDYFTDCGLYNYQGVKQDYDFYVPFIN